LLVFVIPQPQLQPCARLLAEHFTSVRVYRLTDPACLQYKQIAVLGVRRNCNERTGDPALLDASRYLESLAATNDLEVLTNEPDGRYEMPGSQPIVLTNTGIPLDEVEDLLLGSAAYRQASRMLLREQSSVRGRPLTPRHGGHVGLLCTAGMLNGVFGDSEERHMPTGVPSSLPTTGRTRSRTGPFSFMIASASRMS
jgi:hypothetical protein